MIVAAKITPKNLPKKQPKDSSDQFWKKIREQKNKYGSYDSSPINWGEEVGLERIDE